MKSKEEIQRMATICENFKKEESLEAQCESAGRFHGFIAGYNQCQKDLNIPLDSKGGFSEVKDIHKIGLAVKKTAMQQLIDFIKSDDFKYLYDSVKEEWFNTFLEKEKQQIKDAYNSGDYMSSIKERLDYDESDYKYKNADEYFKHITSA